MNKKDIEELEIVKKAIQNHVPALAGFLNCNKRIQEYSADLYKNHVSDFYVERQKIMKKIIKRQCVELFGEEAKNFKLNLDGPIVANMVDHNGILNNPILLSSHLITSASNLFDSKFDILSLNTALYPFNSVFYKRGLGYKEKTLTFISKSKSHQLVYYAKPLNFENYPKEIKDSLENINVEDCEYAWQQAAKINYRIWPRLFNEELRSKLPKLITLNQDEIVRALLLNIIKEKNSFVYDAILDPIFREEIESVFMGTTGAWSENSSSGSFLFWTVDDRNQAVGLKQEGNFLVSSKEGFDYKVELSDVEIVKAIEERQIYAGMVLLFAALLFYTGMVPLSGYGSINYLNIMKEGWLKLLKNKYPEEYLGISNMKIDKLVGGPVLTYYRDEKKEIKSAFMLDVLMSGGLSREYLENIFSMNFNDLLLPAFIDVYNSYVPKKNRQKISITADDIISEQLAWLK
jgi:hypothetical protein